MPYIKMNDLDLFYEELGVCAPILFLHSGYSRGILAFSGHRPHMPMEHCIEVNTRVMAFLKKND